MQYNLKYTYLERLPPDVFKYIVLPYAQMSVPVFNANRQIQSPEFIYSHITSATVAVRRFEQAQISRFSSVPAGTCVVLSQSGHDYNIRTYPSGKLIDMGTLPIGFTYNGHQYMSKICISGNYIIKFLPEMPTTTNAFYSLQVREYGCQPLPMVRLSQKISLNIASGEYTTLDPVAHVLDDTYLVFADVCYGLLSSKDNRYFRQACPDMYANIDDDDVLGRLPSVCTHEFCARNNMILLQRCAKLASGKFPKAVEKYSYGSWNQQVLKIHRGRRKGSPRLPTYGFEVFGNNTNKHSIHIRGNILSYSYDVSTRQISLAYVSTIGDKPKKYKFYACCNTDYMPTIAHYGNVLYVFTRLTAYMVYHGRSIRVAKSLQNSSDDLCGELE